MPRRRRLTIIFAPETTGHLDAIDSKYHRVIQQAIDMHLRLTPTRQTRNRKPLSRPATFGATWELRCGPNNRFRVFYEVQVDEQLVRILAMGVKEGNRLRIGRQEIEL